VADSRVTVSDMIFLMFKITVMNKVKAYYDEAYPPVPSKATLYWRKNLVWQLFRFVVLNVKIMRIVVGGHS